MSVASLGIVTLGASALFIVIGAAGRPAGRTIIDTAFMRATVMCAVMCGVALWALAIRHGPGFTPELGFLMGALVASTWTDLRFGLILDRVTLLASASILALVAARGHAVPALVGMAGASGALLVLHVATRGRGMGLGDVKLAAVIGASLGLYRSFIALGCAFVFGAAVGIVALATHRRQGGSQVAFGPYLAMGSIAAILLGGS